MELSEFLKNWDKEYTEQLNNIPIFQPDLTSKWNNQQKSLFAEIFYHIRAHFHDFLWYVGNHAEDKETKDIILKNIAEEFNGAAKSHEQLYMDFSASLGVNTSKAFIDDKYNLTFVKEFNHNHIKWLHEQSADHRFAALSAYERLDNSLHFSIADDGIGIPQSEIKDIFIPFTQSSRTKTRAGGRGLGLAICKEIIEAHNGKIWAENNIKHGATFHFSLPINLQ